MASGWYIQRHGTQYGPYRSSDLRTMAAAHKVRPNDLIRKQGTKTWARAETVRGLFDSTSPKPIPAAESSRPKNLQPSQTPPSGPAVLSSHPVYELGHDPLLPENALTIVWGKHAPRWRDVWPRRILFGAGSLMVVGVIVAAIWFFGFSTIWNPVDTAHRKVHLATTASDDSDRLLTELTGRSHFVRGLAMRRILTSSVDPALRQKVRKILCDTLDDWQFAELRPDAVRALAVVGSSTDISRCQKLLHSQGVPVEVQTSAIATALELDPAAGLLMYESHVQDDRYAGPVILKLMARPASSEAVGLRLISSTDPDCRYRGLTLLKSHGTLKSLSDLNLAMSKETDPGLRDLIQSTQTAITARQTHQAATTAFSKLK